MLKSTERGFWRLFLPRRPAVANNDTGVEICASGGTTAFAHRNNGAIARDSTSFRNLQNVFAFLESVLDLTERYHSFLTGLRSQSFAIQATSRLDDTLESLHERAPIPEPLPAESLSNARFSSFGRIHRRIYDSIPNLFFEESVHACSCTSCIQNHNKTQFLP